MSYIAQADVENYLGVSLTANGIAQFSLLLPMLQDMIDNYCNRSWNINNPLVQKFDALSPDTVSTARDTFFVDYPPISSIDSITVGGVNWDLQFAYNYKTYIKLGIRPGAITLPNPFGYQSVVITYHSDATTVPAPVKMAFIMWMARLIQTSPDSGKETTEVKTGTVLAKYVTDKVQGVPDFVRMVLNSYRLPAVDRL